MSDPRTELVGRGYDEIADRFLDWRDRIVGDPRLRWLEELMSRLPAGARVLELGCGSGIPDTRLLAERFRVTGVDISAEQIRRARTNVPTADFVQADITDLELEAESYAGVVAVYSFNHIPRQLLSDVFARVRSWLTPDGLFLVSLGTGDTVGWTGRWLGTSMFFSSFEPETNRRLLIEAGFELVLDELATMHEPEPDGLAEATFHWVLGRR
ncbi:MAG TPA: class I SAM-dependent methyltransferase [Gaiellaceae bacterium]|nr:class I SAM-dependent methyltransferase [Gaiellaceae bacterium]